MNNKKLLAYIPTTKTRALMIHHALIESGNTRTNGIDIRKFIRTNAEAEFIATPKGIFLNEEELNTFVRFLGFDPALINPDVAAIFETKETIRMLR